MKKDYTEPKAEKLEFSYDENVTASCGHKYRLYTDKYTGCRETETDIWVDEPSTP